MKKVYIVLSASWTKVSKTIKFFTKFEYCHVSISFDENLGKMYSFWRKKINNVFNAGFVEEIPNVWMLKIYNPKCKIVELKVSDEQYNKINERINNFKNYKNNYKYNFIGLLYILFWKSHRLNYRYTCTQFVASTLNRSWINLNKDESLFIAQDYLTLDNINVKDIWTINEYYNQTQKKH